MLPAGGDHRLARTGPRLVIPASGEQQVALKERRVLVLFRGPHTHELLDRAGAALEAASEARGVPGQVHFRQQRRLDRQIRGRRQRRSVVRAPARDELVVRPSRLRGRLLVTDEQSGEDRLERAVKLGGDEIVDESARHWCLLAVDDRTEPVSEAPPSPRRRAILPVRAADAKRSRSLRRAGASTRVVPPARVSLDGGQTRCPSTHACDGS